ncbi:hypothetical protein GMES_3568 [Paraglaciecola mesophila KMM 241]|uniref:Uncharacterized protein n=1 Tax=Paraglaciecola mesophila KMM 241 TaxID=1128912 RepID=K6ZRD7_9ALTE|nr:hypothetical protein GMES_3568 [Paraglaciecola mesophila KMM 241]
MLKQYATFVGYQKHALNTCKFTLISLYNDQHRLNRQQKSRFAAAFNISIAV